MSLLKSDKGVWTGIAYVYHMDIGWYDEEVWEIDDIYDAYAKFKSIPASKLDKISQKVLLNICELLNKAILSNYQVFISRL